MILLELYSLDWGLAWTVSAVPGQKWAKIGEMYDSSQITRAVFKPSPDLLTNVPSTWDTEAVYADYANFTAVVSSGASF